MLDTRGKLIRIGDCLDVGRGWSTGVVVFSIDTGEYSADYPEEHWAYLERGVMVETEKGGLIYYDHNDGDLEVIDSASG
jgi:hypothetical protein